MALQNSDLFIVERSGVLYKMTSSQLSDFLNAAFAGGTSETNPITVNPSTQEINFNISQLSTLP